MIRSARLWSIIDNTPADTVPTWVARALLADLRDARGIAEPGQTISSVQEVTVDGDTYAWPPIVVCSACGMRTRSDAARSGVRWQFDIICTDCYDELLAHECQA
jgi:hypothetical protein